MKQPALKEKDITKQIRSVLKTFGIFHFKHWGGPMGEKGIPDIIGIYKGKPLFLEIKTITGKVSPEQERFLKNVNDAGGIGAVVRSIDDVVALLGLSKQTLF